MRKYSAIIKRPDERYGHMTHISTRLENLQKIVDGYIEVLEIRPGLDILVNEEGKLRSLTPNLRLPGDVLVGTIIVIGSKDDEFTDVPLTFESWKAMVDKWRAEA